MSVLVAGVGNVFLGDDGFGVAVARHLSDLPGLPGDVVVRDFGIRGIHLAYELTAGHDRAIIIDAVPRGDPPGTLYVLRPDDGPPDRPAGGSGGPPGGDSAEGRAGDVWEAAVPVMVDAHDMTPQAVLALSGTLGEGPACPVLIVGCQPADTSPGMELSPPVAAAVGPAAELVLELLTKEPSTCGNA